ncbi:hypothetical protein VPNG_07909 [Cytospora leucostoma]|uniref:Uncharacterized protein n=1 Tax=Cytospora leucostoma TaxID=1230097 RepID=A0A423WAS9_9PEZI|nr:hypothetical protein VPNG_07909 [Cytospora leucostoma]
MDLHSVDKETLQEPLDILENGNLLLDYDGSSAEARQPSSSSKLAYERRISLYINVILAITLLCCIPIILNRQCECSSDLERYYYYCRDSRTPSFLVLTPVANLGNLSPALEATKPGSHITQFNHTRWSPYNPDSGYPLEYIDGNWSNLLRMGLMGLSEEELIRSGASLTSAHSERGMAGDAGSKTAA